MGIIDIGFPKGESPFGRGYGVTPYSVGRCHEVTEGTGDCQEQSPPTYINGITYSFLLYVFYLICFGLFAVVPDEPFYLQGVYRLRRKDIPEN